MAKIEGVIRDVIERSEWVAIATVGPDGPHLVASWGDYVRKLGIRNDTVMVPAGHYEKTEQNLKHDGRMEMLFATRQVTGSHGPGQGCSLRGRGEVQTSGPLVDEVKAQFPWARGALIIHVEEAHTQL